MKTGPAGADRAFLVILGVIVTLQNHGTPVAQIFFLHVNITFQVGGEDAFYKLGQESVFV